MSSYMPGASPERGVERLSWCLAQGVVQSERALPSPAQLLGAFPMVERYKDQFRR